jgi:hypothetical protein
MQNKARYQVRHKLSHHHKSLCESLASVHSRAHTNFPLKK